MKFKECYKQFEKFLNCDFEKDEIGITVDFFENDEFIDYKTIQQLVYGFPIYYKGSEDLIYARNKDIMDKIINDKIHNIISNPDINLLRVKLNSFITNNFETIFNNPTLDNDTKSILNMLFKHRFIHNIDELPEFDMLNLAADASIGSDNIVDFVNSNIEKLKNVLEKLQSETERLKKDKNEIDIKCDEESYKGVNYLSKCSEIEKDYFKKYPDYEYEDFEESEEYNRYEEYESKASEHKHNADKLDKLSDKYLKRVYELKNITTVISNFISNCKDSKFNVEDYHAYERDLYDYEAANSLYYMTINNIFEKNIINSDLFKINEEEIPEIINMFFSNSTNEIKSELISIMLNSINKNNDSDDRKIHNSK